MLKKWMQKENTLLALNFIFALILNDCISLTIIF